MRKPTLTQKRIQGLWQLRNAYLGEVEGDSSYATPEGDTAVTYVEELRSHWEDQNKRDLFSN